MTDNHDLARRMTYWRARSGLSQERVGKAAGMTKQAIDNIEAGTNSISVLKLNLICKKEFAIDLATFFGPLPKGRAA